MSKIILWDIRYWTQITSQRIKCRACLNSKFRLFLLRHCTCLSTCFKYNLVPLEHGDYCNIVAAHISMTLYFSSPAGFKNYLYDFKWGAVSPIWRTVKIISVSITLSLFPELLTLALFTYISFYSVLSYANITITIRVNISLRKACQVHSRKRSPLLHLATTTPPPLTTMEQAEKQPRKLLFPF